MNEYPKVLGEDTTASNSIRYRLIDRGPKYYPEGRRYLVEQSSSKDSMGAHRWSVATTEDDKELVTLVVQMLGKGGVL